MSRQLPLNFQCDECEAIVRELLDARQADLEDMRKRLFAAASSSGRKAEEMRDAWLSSVARMPDDEIQALMRAHYPRVTAARRKKLDHEVATGHSVDVLASAVLLGYRRLPLLGTT